jgi:hypothetical protein
MTLAAILTVLAVVSAWLPAVSAPGPWTAQTETTAQTQNGSSSSQPQAIPTTTPQAKPPSTGPAQDSTQPRVKIKKPRQRRRIIHPDCTTAGNEKSTAGNPAGNPAPTGKPCPPRKVVVRNGGSDPPAVELKGNTPAEEAVHQRSTEQLTAATEANLSKVAGRTLNPNQQELVDQIHQFMEQSKTAIAAGDPDRGHSLALKAHLLSDELVKP